MLRPPFPFPARLRNLARAMPRYLLALLLLALPLRADPPTTQSISWQNFDDADPATLITSVGPVQPALTDAPTAPAPADGVGGKTLRAITPGKSLLMLRPDLPKNLPDLSDIAFYIHRPAPDHNEEDPVLEVQFREADNKAWFWRRVILTQTGWTRVSLPLRFFRTSDRRNPQWSQVHHLAFFFRNKADVQIDAIRFLNAPDLSARLQTSELARIAFPDSPENQVRIIDHPTRRLLTNAPDLDHKALADHLDQAVALVQKDFAFLSKPSAAPTLIVFATDDQYRAFPPRFAGLLDAKAGAPTSDGFTFHAMATSAWNAPKGSLRPVYAHEFIHSYLELSASLPDDGGWVHEGLASFYQLRLHPQANFAALVRQSLADPAAHLPLNELCSGKRIPLNRYWQALTVWNFLLSTPAYRDKLPALFDYFRTTAGTNLLPALETVFKTDLPAFTQEWKEFCAQAYQE